MLRYNPFIKTIAALIVCLVISGYAYSRTIDVIKGPEIIINSPTSGALAEQELVTINGQALRIAKLYLNGRQIFTDETGKFSESLLVPKGYSTLYIEAVDMFNRTTTNTITVVRKV